VRADLGRDVIHHVAGAVARSGAGRTAGFSAVLAALLFWRQQQQPTNAADWADDVAQMTTGAVDGNQVTLHNVRDFEWRSDSDYTQRWTTRSYDLNHLISVDMIMSYWAGPAIAHMIVSFGFDNGDQVAFSMEVCRRRGIPGVSAAAPD
jgi:hypothetical protein